MCQCILYLDQLLRLFGRLVPGLGTLAALLPHSDSTILSIWKTTPMNNFWDLGISMV
jgi:hypothetical protein